jgi:hypothetical protein
MHENRVDKAGQATNFVRKDKPWRVNQHSNGRGFCLCAWRKLRAEPGF